MQRLEPNLPLHLDDQGPSRLAGLAKSKGVDLSALVNEQLGTHHEYLTQIGSEAEVRRVTSADFPGRERRRGEQSEVSNAGRIRRMIVEALGRC